MTVDREIRCEKDRYPKAEAELPVNRPANATPEPSAAAPVSRATLLAYLSVGLLLVSWFLVDWLVLRKGFVDSVGELLGIGFALLLLVAIVGTVRHSRRG